MSKIKLTSVSSINEFAKKPKPVMIGADCEGFFKKLTLDEFFAIQDSLQQVDTMQKELAKDDKAENTRKLAEFSRDTIIDVMVKVMVTEAGEPAFTEADKVSLCPVVNLEFTKDFIEAFMKSQGVGKEEVASAEASF